MILGLVGNITKQALRDVLPGYVDWLRRNEIPFLISSDFTPFFQEDLDFLPPAEIAEKAHVLLSFGGDGTFLNTVNLLQGHETPVLGVNIGGLGYLTEVGADELYNRTEDLLEGRWKIERRMVLEARLENDSTQGPWYALNEVVVERGAYPRMIQLRTTIDGKFLNTYHADGLLISTPTGSTGYSLSAGGPIVEPKMAAIIVHPLNPHSLTNRPLLISDDKAVRVEAKSPYKTVSIEVDGQIACQPEGEHTLIVRRASFSACLVTFEGRYFYEVLRRKLKWGDRG